MEVREDTKKTADKAQAVQEETKKTVVNTPAGKKGSRKSKKKKIIIAVIIALVAAAALLLILRRKNAEKQMSAARETGRTTATVTRGEISNSMTSSGTLQPKDTYTITSLVSGKILKADFEEGDEVKEGDVLYVIDSTDIQAGITSAEKTLASAQEDYDDAVSDYSQAEEKLEGLQVLSTQTGYVKDLKLKAGDSVQPNGEIATVYNDTSMLLRVPFLSYEADSLYEGQGVTVTLSDSGEQIAGRITAKSARKESMSGGVVVKYVTVAVTNPGGLSEQDTAVVSVGEICSAGDGNFEASVSERLCADVPSGVKVEKVLVGEGQYVQEGTPLFSVTEESAKDALKSAGKTLSQAETSLETAKDRLDSLKDQLEEYTITAPIDGRVIYKNAKAGDKVSTGGSNTASLALIYDLSTLTFEMSIDELDISKIRAGQEVIVTADAFTGEEFSGAVTNVSLNGSYSSGVTTYPVVVTLKEKGSLLPSMNVNGTIILEKSTDTLLIPSEALNRGNIVYVETASIPEGTEVNAVENANAPEGYTAVSVVTGLTSDDSVEILSGLSEGMTVYAKSAASGGFSFNMQGMPGGDFPGGGMPSGGFGGSGGPSGASGGRNSSDRSSGGFGGGSGGRSGGGMPGGF